VAAGEAHFGYLRFYFDRHGRGSNALAAVVVISKWPVRNPDPSLHRLRSAHSKNSIQKRIKALKHSFSPVEPASNELPSCFEKWSHCHNTAGTVTTIFWRSRPLQVSIAGTIGKHPD
jgi:hypothetical protein